MGNLNKLLVAIVAAPFVVGGIAIAEDFNMQKASELFEVKCAKCHTIERPKGKNKSQEDWTVTVKRMQAKSPGWFTDDEAKVLIEYLSRANGQ